MNQAAKLIKPYGDTLNDGKVQISFTLPIQASPEGIEAARQLAVQMGLSEIKVVEMKDLGEGFSFFIIYGAVQYQVDLNQIKVKKITTKSMDYYAINQYIQDKLGSKITVIGASTGSDAHTVGLDAIMNMKGFAGEYGLERYPEIRAINMGSQVPNEVLIKRALAEKADAILISQIVDEKGVHIKNLTEFVELLEVEGLRENFIIIAGGPRLNHELALELGFDAGFGKGTFPNDVASYICQTLVERRQKLANSD